MRVINPASILIFGFLLSLNTYSKKFTHNISEDVKVEYHQDGLVKIYSTDDKGKQIHYFSIKLENLSSKKQQSNLDVPISISQMDNSIFYKWNENISEEWRLETDKIIRILTIYKKPSIQDSNDKLSINSILNTDLGMMNVSGKKSYVMYEKKLRGNLRIDEASFSITDSNCNQLIVEKGNDSFEFDTINIDYPIVLSQDIKINYRHSNFRGDREIFVNGNTMVVSDHDQNIVKVYENKNNNWHHIQTILPEVSNGLEYTGGFGTKLALSKSTLAISAYDDFQDSECLDCEVAAVYLYKKINGHWKKQTRLVAPYKPNKNGYGNFGSSLDMFEDILVVGDDQRLHEFTGKNMGMLGAIYIFEEFSDKWTLKQTILPTDNDSDFGKSVAIDKNTLIIGGTHSGNYTGWIKDIKEADYGQLHIYHFENKKWHKQSQIRIMDFIKKHEYYDRAFADSIDISNNTIVVGNPLSNNIGIRGFNIHRDTNSWEIIDPNLDQAGEAYVFKKQANKWKMQARLKAPNPLQLDHFGKSVKIINDTIVIGAYGDSSRSVGINGDSNNCQLPSSGAVYVFEEKWNGWKQSDYIKSDNPQKLDLFGEQLDSDGETIIVNSNDIHVYNRESDSWKKIKHIKTHPNKLPK